MLALDLVEHRARLGILALVEPLPGEVVEGVDVAGDILGVGAGLLAPGGAAGERKDEAGEQKRGDEAGMVTQHGGLLSEGLGRGQARTGDSYGDGYSDCPR
jgi:hypothetical protein